MSTMIKSGLYNINNVQYSNRYIVMSGNNEFVGHDVPDTFYVDVVDETGLYLTLDEVGLFDTEPQILQLSSEDGKKFIIHPQDVNEIYVGPAAASSNCQLLLLRP
ncbi:hypothetical protein BDR07DRAFT_1445409, partial [Suillus spraguei]